MNSKGKVLLLTLSTFKYDARVKTYAAYLRSKGYEVVIVSAKEHKNEELKIQNEYLNYRVIIKYRGHSSLTYILYYLKFLIKSFFVISWLSFKHKFEFVHYNNTPNFIIFSCLFPKILGSKIILDNHDIMPLVFTAKFKNNKIYKMALFEQKISMKFADKILCADHNQKDYLVETGIPEDKVTVVLNVPNPQFFTPNQSEGETANGTINLVYHGTISYRLGIDQVVEAIALLRNDLNNFCFHLIGTGDYLENINQLVKEKNLQDYIKIYGKNIPVEELSKILNKMHMGIIGNRNSELADYMLPVKLLEYIFMGKAVIAPRNKIISRYFSDDMVCFYTSENVKEMAEKILYLYKNQNVRNNYSQCALKFAGEYNYSTEMAKYQKVIDQLLP